MIYPYLIGYLFAIIGTCLLVGFVSNTMWKEMGWDGDPSDDDIRPYAWQSRAVGFLEAILYVSSLIHNKPEFIAIWLALKVAGQWGRWSEDKKTSKGKNIMAVQFIMYF